MANFKASFTYYPTDTAALNAPIRVEFNNTTDLGPAMDNDPYTYAIDKNNNIYTPSKPLSSYTISSINRTTWDYGDETYSNDYNSIKKYDFANKYIVKLKVQSNDIYDEVVGIFFNIISVSTIELTINSMILTWIKMHMSPAYLEKMEENGAMADMFSATSQMYDRMYKEISDVANLMDVTTVAPKFLQYFSDTLNHKRFYAEKIGYAAQEDDANKDSFLNYDIFERIEKNIANSHEIDLFRQFILDTASIFKQNGSKQCIESFFKLYNFMIHVKEMWTKTFDKESSVVIKDDFFLDPILKNSHNKFLYDGISVIGLDNSDAKISANFNNLLIDNYHFISTVSYPTDVIFEDGCYQKFEINDYNPNIKEVLRSDGRPLDDKSSCGFNITSNCGTTGTTGTTGVGTTGTSAISGSTTNTVIIEKNSSWTGVNKLLLNSLTYKFWNAPTGYIKSLIDTVGTTQTSANYLTNPLFADWSYGVTVPDGIPGVNQSFLRKPTLTTTLPKINYVNTITNENLIQIPNFQVPTDHDFFIVIRGFIKIPQNAYYVFGLENGNPNGTGLQNQQHVTLLNLKHTEKYDINTIGKIDSLDNFNFIIDDTIFTTTIGPTGNSITLYSKKGEYAIVDIQQKENYNSSGYYNLESGYYYFELKSTYGELYNKKLSLYWAAYSPYITNTGVLFENVIPNQIIPSENYLTFNETQEVIENTIGKGYLNVSNTLIEGGDKINIVYSQSKDNANYLSGIISSDKQIKNFEMNYRFSSSSINDFEINNNRILPQKTILSIFRAKYTNKNLYSNIDSYYAVILDGFNGSISLGKFEYSPEKDDLIIHKLNLNPNLTQLNSQIFDKIIIDENGYNFQLEDDIYYDIKILVNEDLVSVYYRKNINYTNLTQNITQNVDNILSYDDSETPFSMILENISLNQSEKDVISVDKSFVKINSSIPYVADLNAGYYGLFVKASIFEVIKFNIKSLDVADEVLLETNDKYKTIKSKFLDSRSQSSINYGINTEIASAPIYSILATNSFSTSANVINLGNTATINDNNVYSLVANNLNVSDFGTRLNIVFDGNYLSSKFKTVNEVLNSFIIPIGNFFEPYVNWCSVDGSIGAYSKSVHGGYTPFVSENAKLLPHTIAVSGSQKFNITKLNRSSTNNLNMYAGSFLSTILNSTNSTIYNGIWEEICPNSSSETWTYSNSNSNVTINNEVFEPIYKNKLTKEQVIGVKVVSTDILNKLIDLYCCDTVVWGLYEITLPNYTVNAYERFNNVVPDSIINPIQYFVPIGKINSAYLFYLPASEILRNSNATIKLKGVYVNRSIDNISITSTSSLLLNTQNYWENKYKSKMLCNYYLDVNTKLAFNLDEYESNIIDYNSNVDKCNGTQEIVFVANANECNTIPNVYFAPKNIRSLITYLEYSSSNFSSDFDWWYPSDILLKRPVTPSYPTNSDSVLYSGLNTPNSFYTGNSIFTGHQGLKLSVSNDYALDITKYLLDTTWCVSSVGWDSKYAISTNNESGVGLFNSVDYTNIGFTQTSKSKMGYEEIISVSTNMNTILPLQTISISGQYELYFGNYLDGEVGVGRTMSPYGIYNWFTSHANPINTVNDNDREGWSILELNDQFVNCFTFNTIYGYLNKGYYKFNNYWNFFANSIPEKNSIIKIKEFFQYSNKQNDLTLGVSDGLTTTYAIPSKYYYYPNWFENIKNIYVDEYTIPADIYYLSINSNNETLLTINTQSTEIDFTKFKTNTQLMLNVYADDSIGLNLEKNSIYDNFNNIRNINWIPHIQNNYGSYIIGTRIPDNTLKVTEVSLPYNIVTYKGQSCYQLVNKLEKDTYTYNNTNNIVGLQSNNNVADNILLIDKSSTNFSISCDVIFDDNISNADIDKKFEFILKAVNSFSNDRFGITDYYFVGIGTYNFDIGLGLRFKNKTTGLIEETYLASFGNFNVKGIQSNIWYTLKASITQNYINIYFAEKGNDLQLVLHYNIDKKYEKFTERYLKGEFENLQNIVYGLSQLSIVYPSDLGTVVSPDYTLQNFKADLAKTLPINGFYNGIKAYNSNTYITNVEYTYNEPKKYSYGQTFDYTTYDSMLQKIKDSFELYTTSEIHKVQQSLNYIFYVLIDDVLYYQEKDHLPDKYKNKVEDFYVIDDRIYIIEKYNIIDSDNYDRMLRIYKEGFTQEYPIMIKDKTFFKDELRSYMQFSNKKINQIFINDNRLHIKFKDI